jgi:hypothetical protein
MPLKSRDRMTEKMSKKGKVAGSKRKCNASKTARQKERWEGTVYGYGLDGKELGEKEEIKNNNKGFGDWVTFYFDMNQLDFCKDFSVPF